MQNKFQKVFDAQKSNFRTVGNTSCKTRVKKLKALKYAILNTYKADIRQALYNDFKKPFQETDLTEIYPVISEINHAVSHLKSWMKRKKVHTPLPLLGTSAWYTFESKGVCLIVSPWNFPLNLTFGPLVSAVAAGNTVFLKPSELTPHISAVMAKIVSELFPENEVILVQGDVEVATALLQLPFNHIFFTGSPAVGKIVMEAAAKHLSSVTLELGGKSPVIIDETANLKQAASRLAWGKFVNNGQTCIAPDYLFIHENIKSEFLNILKTVLDAFFMKAETSESYGRIVNERHFKRLQSYIEEARENYGVFEIGGKSSATECFIEPTVITNLPESVALFKEEIFGPVLPVKTFSNLDDVVSYINSEANPLALYIYSKNRANIQYVIENTRAGSTAINCNVLQYSNHHLPFGGMNNSGIGKAHGFFGFQEFSNMRSVLKQHTKGSLELLFPPYTGFKQKLLDFTLKWL